MKSYVYCKTEHRGVQTFYLNHLGHNYPLFAQAYRASVRELFHKAYLLEQGFDYTLGGNAVRRTLDKIKQAIPHVEREWNICVLKRTQRKNDARNERRILRDRERRVAGGDE